MKFPHFVLALDGMVDSFYKDYEANMRSQPEHYPDEFPSIADWLEQFIVYIEDLDIGPA